MSTTTTYMKLVRNLVPRGIRSRGGKPKTVILNGSQIRRALARKLLEESEEVRRVIFARKKVDKDKLMDELADVLEVLDAIRYEFELSLIDVIRIKTLKAIDKGGFSRRIFLKSVKE